MSVDVRAKGAFPLSIATSLAIEGLLGRYPDRVQQVNNIANYDELWINLKTIYRNLVGAYSGLTVPNLDELYEQFLEELQFILDVIRDESGERLTVVFYVSDYKNLERDYKFAQVRVDNTDKQKIATANMISVVGRALKELPKSEQIKIFDLKLGKQRHEYPKTLILTHIPFDLLSHRSFRELHLLESHTGVIKKRSQWSTKYYNGKELTHIPFREDLLQVFGDRETFSPMDKKLRDEILEIAKKYKWTSVSTDEKIDYGLNQISNNYAKDILKILKKH